MDNNQIRKRLIHALQNSEKPLTWSAIKQNTLINQRYDCDKLEEEIKKLMELGFIKPKIMSINNRKRVLFSLNF